MSARHKLNAAHFSGAVILAALLGTLAGSWGVFWVTGAALIVAGLLGRDIRPGGGRRR
jgi:hypothetical protein